MWLLKVKKRKNVESLQCQNETRDLVILVCAWISTHLLLPEVLYANILDSQTTPSSSAKGAHSY